MKKKLALVNYHDPFFWDFSQRLEKEGFEVYWVNSRILSSNWMRSNGAKAERICDVLEGSRRVKNLEHAIAILSEYEQEGLPTFNSIIFMDQNLRNAKYADAVEYLAEAAVKIREFLTLNEIRLVSSGRDTALQSVAMLVCKKMGIWWGCVTRTKLPKAWFGFSPTLQGDCFIKIRDVSPRDYELAKEWLDSFRQDVSIKPFARPKINGIRNFLQQLIHSFKVLFQHLTNRIKGGSTRKIPGAKVILHLKRYVWELRNYLYYRMVMKFDPPVDEPFVLYGLHRQPESSIDVRGAFFDDQLALIKQISRSLPVTHKLYVKVHFSDVAGQSPGFYKRLRRYPGVKLIDPDVDSRSLINRASIIITNVGAMGQEGGYLDKPVIAMSKMFWCELPTVRLCNSPPELPDLIASLLKTPPAADYEGVLKFIAGYLSNSFPCDPDLGFMNTSFTSDELTTLAEAYNYIYQLMIKDKDSG